MTNCIAASVRFRICPAGTRSRARPRTVIRHAVARERIVFVHIHCTRFGVKGSRRPSFVAQLIRALAIASRKAQNAATSPSPTATRARSRISSAASSPRRCLARKSPHTSSFRLGLMPDDAIMRTTAAARSMREPIGTTYGALRSGGAPVTPNPVLTPPQNPSSPRSKWRSAPARDLTALLPGAKPRTGSRLTTTDASIPRSSTGLRARHESAGSGHVDRSTGRTGASRRADSSRCSSSRLARAPEPG